MTKFKYQNIIKDAINETYYAQAPLYLNCLSELDDVYKQATQNKEDKIKAEAWDKYKTHMERHIAGEINEEEFVSDLKSDYFEKW